METRDTPRGWGIRLGLVMGVGHVRSETTTFLAEVGESCAGEREGGTGRDKASEAIGQVELELARNSF